MKLKVVRGPNEGFEIDLLENEDVTIGRDPKAEVCLNDSKCSRRHARVFKDKEHFCIEDLNSTNGTLLNGKNVFRLDLKNNDEIIIGNTLIKFSGADSASSSASSSVKIEETFTSTMVLSAMPHKEADMLSGQHDNIAAREDLAQENRSLRKICELTQWVASTKDKPEVFFKKALEYLITIMQADTAFVIMVNPDKKSDWQIQSFVSISNHDTASVSKTLVEQVLTEGVAILASDTHADERFDPSQSIISEGIASAVLAPLKVEGRFLGILVFDRRNEHAECFTSQDVRFAATMGNLLGLYLEKEKLEEEAQKKQRLAIIGEVIAGLAHHTKNIITGLKFSISALEVVSGQKKWDMVEKCIKSIHSQEKRISDLVLNMLTYSKERKPIRRWVDLNMLFAELVEPYQSHFTEQNIQYTYFSEPDIPKLYAEESALHRAFLNLLVNTLDSFKIHRQKENKNISIDVRFDALEQNFEIEFRDTGCGIPPDKISDIFNIFYSTKGNEGTGLGLAVVHKIIGEHGGDIKVSSVEHEFTAFHVTLPLVLENDDTNV